MRLNLKLLIIARKNIKREKNIATCNNRNLPNTSEKSVLTFTYKGNRQKQEHHASTFSNTKNS